MKLNELNFPSQSNRIARVMENQLGLEIKLDTLTEFQTQHMLRRVRARINEARAVPSFHNSEQSPSYLKLVMLEQVLQARLEEQIPATPSPSTGMNPAPKPGQPATGVVNPAQSAAKMKMADQERKKQIQDAIKAKQKELQDLQRQLSAPPSPVTAMEARRWLKENEVQQAQVVLAAQDMIDRVQKMTEQISEMQFKDLPALTASIKNDMGTEQATAFNQQASAALSQLLAAVQEGRTQLESAQSAITGQQPIVPGEEEAAAAGAEAGAEAGAAGAEADALSAELGAELGAEEGSEEEASLGRERR